MNWIVKWWSNAAFQSVCLRTMVSCDDQDLSESSGVIMLICLPILLSIAMLGCDSHCSCGKGGSVPNNLPYFGWRLNTWVIRMILTLAFVGIYTTLVLIFRRVTSGMIWASVLTVLSKVSSSLDSFRCATYRICASIRGFLALVTLVYPGVGFWVPSCWILVGLIGHPHCFLATFRRSLGAQGYWRTKAFTPRVIFKFRLGTTCGALGSI